jgi:hypothetical protein
MRFEDVRTVSLAVALSIIITGKYRSDQAFSRHLPWQSRARCGRSIVRSVLPQLHCGSADKGRKTSLRQDNHHPR